MNWISVKEKLPDEWVSVLGFMPDEEPFPTVREVFFTDGKFLCAGLLSYVKVTHWMPLPEPPKEEA